MAGRVLVLDLSETGLCVAVLAIAPPRVELVGLAPTDEVGGRRLDESVAALLAELAGPDPTPDVRRTTAAAAIAAALEAGDVAAAARDLKHVDAVLTRWALDGPNAH